MIRTTFALLIASGFITTSTVHSEEVSAADSKTPSGFTIHETAPESVSEVYDNYQANFGFVPNMAKIMAGSPALLRSYAGVQKNIKQYSTLTREEINVVQLALSVENKCRYCVSGHTMAGKGFHKTPIEYLQAIREQAVIDDPKLNVLRDFSLEVYENRGSVSDEQLNKFYEAGYTREQALDVVACIAAKVMSNYTNALGKTELNKSMEPFAPGLSLKE